MGFVWFFAALFAAHVAIDLLLTLGQIAFVKRARNEKPSALSSEDWQIAADYEVASLRLEVVQGAAAAIMQIVWLLAGFALLDAAIAIDNATLKAAVFMALYMTIMAALNQPFCCYKTFAIDEKFGFNRSTKRLFLIDLVKSLALMFVICFAVACAIAAAFASFAIDGARDLAYSGAFALFGIVMTFIVLANLLFPYFAKLFNKFEPIDDTSLGAKIKTLLGQAGFGAKGVFRIDANKRDSRLNAYFAGLGKTKRVALYDTLIEKLSEREILAVLGHELGHFKHRDIIKRLCAIGIEMLIFCILLAAIGGVDFYAALNLPKETHITLTIYLIFVASPIAFFFQPIVNAISRRAEFAADAYGARLTDKAELKSALVKLASENKTFPKKLPIYALWRETHPNILTRLKRLDDNG
ncbi:MAG: M48 family metallopeptidase [Helicobacteraceae bacterium]|nr:M48 family metallopeptidase [Helicobacteraceae bacterium]